MRVLSTIIVPPHLTASGGASAGEALSAALVPHCHMTVASMMAGYSGDADGAPDAPERAEVRVGLPALFPWQLMPTRHRTPFYASNIPDIVRGGGYDLVHLHNPMPALEMERVARACRANGIPYVVSAHGFNEVANGESVYRFGRLRSMAWKNLAARPVARVVRGAAAVCALSPADFDIIRAFGFRGEEIAVVSNGVTPPGPPDEAADDAVCRKYGIAPEKRVGQITCMFLANHTPNKGLPILLEAFASLETPYLLVIGGEKRDLVDYEKYQKNVRPGQQIVVTGRLSDAEISSLFRRSDLFVFPTLADTFPLVVLEAMAHGLPVLASRVGGIPHELGDDCGVLVEPGDARALAREILRLEQDPRALAEMGRNAAARATSEFTWQRAASRAYACYEQIMRARRQTVRNGVRPYSPAA